MFHALKNLKRQRREHRRRLALDDASSYPPDMSPDVVETIIQVKDFTMTSVDRLNGLCEAVRYLCQNKIEGDVVECGVWRGGSMMAVASMLKRLDDSTRQLYLFDTYEGMSEPSQKDVSIQGETARSLLKVENPKDPTSVWCISSLEEVQANVATIGYQREHLHFVPGKVEDTIPKNGPEKIALLRLDTDWYESTAHEMEHLFPRLVEGGVLIIDDYGHWEGARRAIDEYFEKHRVGMMLHRLDYTGRIGIHQASVKRGDSG